MTNKENEKLDEIHIESNQHQFIDDDNGDFIILNADIDEIENDTIIDIEDAVVISSSGVDMVADSHVVLQHDIEDAVVVSVHDEPFNQPNNVINNINTMNDDVNGVDGIDDIEILHEINPIGKSHDKKTTLVVNADNDIYVHTQIVDTPKTHVYDDVFDMIEVEPASTPKIVNPPQSQPDKIKPTATLIDTTEAEAVDVFEMIEVQSDDKPQKEPKESKESKESNTSAGYLHTLQSAPAVETAPANATPETIKSDNPPELDVSSDSIRKKNHAFFPKNFAMPLLFLAGSSVLGVWVMQQSINAYFLQTYHKPSPLADIDNGVWKAGAKIHDSLAQVKQDTAKSAPTEQATPKTEPKTVVQTPPPPPPTPTMTPEQVKADIIKTSLTLNKTQKVFFAGDSLMQGVAPHIQKHLQQSGIQSINLSKQSTGLAYPKFFDWQTTIKETIGKDKDIKVLIIMLGPNDPWDMPVKGGKYLKFQSPEWDSEYQSRMADILDFAKENHVGVIWITPPNMKKEKLDTQMMHINTVMMQELERHNVQIIDSRPVMGGIDNRYSDYLIKDDKKIKMRSGDGIHFSPDGQRELARHIQSFLTIES